MSHPASGLTRRGFLNASCSALAGGGLALRQRLSLAAALDDGHPLAPKPGHFRPKAKRMILIFLTGGMSHIDTFDYKPQLAKDHNKKVDPEVFQHGSRDRFLQPSRFKFAPCGESGMMVSELFPELRRQVDRMAFIHSMTTDHNNHFEATLMMHTGSFTVPMPSIGAWLSYGLGTLNTNLPSYVVFAANDPYAGSQVWDANFLPGEHQGVKLSPGPDPIPHLRPQVQPVKLRELEQIMLRRVNEKHAKARPENAELKARMTTFDTAVGLMSEAPEILDLSGETKEMLDLYGVKPGDNRSFAWQCLVARRLSERGVRVVELIDTGASGNWDQHSDMSGHVARSRMIDRPVAALLEDLHRSGQLDETLVVCTTEFGRTPGGRDKNHQGRDHHRWVFTCWLAGGGVKPGVRYGESDVHGLEPASDPVHVHDLHASLLHLMGIDHTRLTYRYAGRDFRLTDVHGRVVTEILS